VPRAYRGSAAGARRSETTPARCRVNLATKYSVDAAVRRVIPRSVAIILPNFIAHPRHLRHLAHRVDTNNVRTGEHRRRDGRRGGPVTLACGDLAAERPGEEQLP